MIVVADLFNVTINDFDAKYLSRYSQLFVVIELSVGVYLVNLLANYSMETQFYKLSDVVSGYGDMALANSIGSNIFEVLFCLGIPWMVETASSGKSLDVMGGMMFVSICLIISSLIPLVLISLNSWIIDRKLGGIMILMYILFIVLDTYYELETSPPPCT